MSCHLFSPFHAHRGSWFPFNLILHFPLLIATPLSSVFHYQPPHLHPLLLAASSHVTEEAPLSIPPRSTPTRPKPSPATGKSPITPVREPRSLWTPRHWPSARWKPTIRTRRLGSMSNKQTQLLKRLESFTASGCMWLTICPTSKWVFSRSCWRAPIELSQTWDWAHLTDCRLSSYIRHCCTLTSLLWSNCGRPISERGIWWILSLGIRPWSPME